MRFNLPLEALPPDIQRFLDAFWARRGPLGVFLGVVIAGAVALALSLPPWYRAQSTLLPPAEGSDAFGVMTGLIQTSALNKLGLISTATASDVLVEILRSRTLHEELIRRFDLQESYGSKNMDLALMDLDSHLAVDVNKSGVVLINVEDRDPRRAAEMANALVTMLDHFNRETYVTKAKRTREFLEGRLSDVSSRLAQAESSLTAYERVNKVLASNEEAAVRGMAGVIAQKLSLQVRRSYVSSYSRPDSPMLREIDAEMAAFDRELAKLPGLKQEGSRLALEAEIQRKVFSLLTAEYENARVQELRDTPTITVLDAARPPFLRSRPRRGVIVLAATGIALVLSAIWVGLRVREPRRA